MFESLGVWRRGGVEVCQEMHVPVRVHVRGTGMGVGVRVDMRTLPCRLAQRQYA